MEELVSVVIPVYKVEQYLEFCLNSIRNQTYQNMEIILVDDGSPDRCPEICDRYAKLDKRFSVVHKQNGGLSDARNVGLIKSKGKYITFIDSDDFVKKDYIEILYKQMKINNADITICDYQETKISLIEYDNNQNDITIMNNYQALVNTYVPQKHGMAFVTWGKLYRTSLFKDNNILFPAGKIHEDTFTTYKLFYYSSSIVFCSEKLYFYRNRNGSIMNSGFSSKNLDKLEALENACKFFLDKNELSLLGYALNAEFVTCLDMRKNLNADSNIKHTINSYYHNAIIKYLKRAQMPYLKKLYYIVLKFICF